MLVDAVAALQDFERSVEPRLPEGAAVAARYVDAMVQRAWRFAGRSFLRSKGRGGGVLLLARVTDSVPADGQRTYASLGGSLFTLPSEARAQPGR